MTLVVVVVVVVAAGVVAAAVVVAVVAVAVVGKVMRIVAKCLQTVAAPCLKLLKK